MRVPFILMAVAALALTGCGRAIERTVDRTVARHAGEPGQEWSMQVLGTDADRIFLVSGPEGKTAAARIAGGVSTLIADTEAQGLLSAGEAVTAAAAPLPEKVAIEAPGFSLKVAAEDNGDDGKGRGRVRINVGGIKIAVDGDDTSGGQGQVRIDGVNADAASKFIDDIDELSPEVKKQMRDKLGL